MSRKTYEIAFAINGKMASSFNGAFSGASSKMAQLRIDISKLNAQYRKGEIGAELYRARHQRLSSQLQLSRLAQEGYNRALQKQHDIQKVMNSAVGGSVRNALSVGVGGGALALGAGGFVIGSAISKAMAYEAQLSSIQALTGITNEELAKMDELALKMGADTKYSALQAAQGIEELLKAGMSPATVQAGGLEAALNLATAGGLDLTESAETLSDALNGFKKDGMSSADAANILAGAANASSTDVHKLRESLQAVGPVGDLLGANFKSINGTLAAFSNNSLKGSDAGTSLKTMLMNLQPQTKEARALFQKFGLTAANGKNQFFQANGQLKDMADVAGLLQEKFKDLNDQQRADAFYNLFGSDAVRAASILYKEGAEGIQKMYREMSDVTALEVARKKMNNAAGSVEQLKGAIETLQIKALKPTLPYIKKFAESFGDFIERYTPAIVNEVKYAVDTASGYLRTHFIDNADFQKLDKQGKIDFIFADLKQGFDTWYAGGGGAQIDSAASSLVGFLSNTLANNSPKMVEAGLQIGTSLGQGVSDGLNTVIRDNPIAAMLVGAAAGSKFGPWGAAGGAIVGLGDSARRSYKDHDIVKQKQTDKVLAETYDPETIKILKQFDPSWNAPGTTNGNISTPFPNARQMVPNLINNTGGSTWKAASEKLGASNIAIHAPFSLVIHGNAGPETVAALEQSQKSFTDNLQNEFRRQKRLSFDGG